MYFAALLARTEEDGWEASDTELDDVENLADLADLARAAAFDDEPVLVCIEQEDDWFGVVRVDGEDDPRVFVSDAAAALRSSYGEILLTDELGGRGQEGSENPEEVADQDEPEDGTAPETEELEEAGEAGAAAESAPPGPLGDSTLLSDLGLEEKDLLALTPEDALSELADALGCTDVLETVR